MVARAAAETWNVPSDMDSNVQPTTVQLSGGWNGPLHDTPLRSRSARARANTFGKYPQVSLAKAHALSKATLHPLHVHWASGNNAIRRTRHIEQKSSKTQEDSHATPVMGNESLNAPLEDEFVDDEAAFDSENIFSDDVTMQMGASSVHDLAVELKQPEPESVVRQEIEQLGAAWPQEAPPQCARTCTCRATTVHNFPYCARDES